jgi:hypothetical protein
MSKKKHEDWLGWFCVLIILIVVAGFVIGLMYPGPITGLILPIGLLLWWLLYQYLLWKEKKDAQKNQS